MNQNYSWQGWGVPPFSDYLENSFPDYPLYVGDPIPDPNRVGDFPLKKLHELFYYPPVITKSTDGWNWSLPLSNKTVWFDQIDGGQKFVLELAGYSKEEIGVKIDGEFLKVEKKKPQNIVNPESQYVIPSANILDLEKFSAKMENGLLEISFPPKKNKVSETIVIF